MKYGLQMFSVLLVLAFVTGAVAKAQGKAVQTMAGVLLTLNHFPSDADKNALQNIVDDKQTTAHERTVARALINVEHRVGAEDKAQLEALLGDESAPESVKTLAAILVNLEHTPTDADKEKLSKLAS